MNILLLAHRLPYPPNKGDKIRSYHLLRHLSKRHRVFLGTFIDDPVDEQYLPFVRRFCADLHCARLRPRTRRVASLMGLVRGDALSVRYYSDDGMRSWVSRTLADGAIDLIIAFSSTMAQFVEADRFSGLPRIADFVDVDSDKWLQYSQTVRWPMAWLYAREGRRLLAYERAIAARFDATFFVSPAEAALFQRLAPESAAKVASYGMGVDTAYFDPSLALECPYAPGGPVAVFTGAMDYWPNVDAVTWFAQEVMPLVRRAAPDMRFAIVGSNPGARVRELERLPGVLVTGRVPDVRPYLLHAGVAVVPLRIARGVQSKMLEALAMARPVVCTPAATQGLVRSPTLQECVADDAYAFARKVVASLGSGSRPENREFVIGSYDWDRQLDAIDRLIDARALRSTGEQLHPVAA